ncbi:VCBS repeat-containing protein [Gammaproteobacteria bacterium LSUCC0112]|nr:VCBS repeat-containing protein [Gammaproteobacteria bacterium LSUCC0112]
MPNRTAVFKYSRAHRRSPSMLALAFTLLSPTLLAQGVGDQLTDATSSDGRYISWQEQLVDDAEMLDFVLSGGDGLVMTDIDNDGYIDIVSVHESDSSYDSANFTPGFEAPPEGYVRIAFGSADPTQWHNITVAKELDAAAPEDAAVADMNGDGYMDILVAAELSHVLYLQNPGPGARDTEWPRLKLPMTVGRGSYIRVFAADIDGDGVPEVIAPNKGAQIPGPEDFAVSNPVSIFKVSGDPLMGGNWQEIELGRYSIPQNSEPVDLDGDGDIDIVIGTRGEDRLVWFDNPGDGSLNFIERAIGINGARMAGFNLEYADLNGDGRLDIIGAGVGPVGNGLVWIEQPARKGDAWNARFIGTFAPDSITGLETADINGDGHIDVFAGSYSRGEREADDANAAFTDPLGRLGWFQNPGVIGDAWTRYDVSRRKRGMFDKFIAHDMDGDGDVDFVGTRGNSYPYDGVFWLEQVRSSTPGARFVKARAVDSVEVGLP